jgi:hypothetical protein
MPPDARMELSHLDPFTLADSGDYPPLVVVNEVRTLKSHCAWQKGDHAGNPPLLCHCSGVALADRHISKF